MTTCFAPAKVSRHRHRFAPVHRVALLLFALLLPALPVVAAELASDKSNASLPGDEAVLRELLQNAMESKARYLRIPPGIYTIGPDASGKAHVLLEDVHNLTIDARGVELVMTEGLKIPLLAIYNCSNITIRGLTLDCDPVTFLQGRIAGMADDRSWYDVKIDTGYDLDPVADSIPMRPMNILDASTPELSWKHGVIDFYPERLEWVPGEERVLRWHVMPHCRGRYPVEVGDPAVLPAFGAPGFTARGSVNITFDECTIYQSASMAFHEHGGDGNTLMLKCRVMRRPGSGRLLSTNADGFHSKNMRRGPTIEGCLFEGMHDDGINIHGMFGRVAAPVDQATAVNMVPCFEEFGKAGDRFEFFSGKTGASLGTRTLVRATQTSAAERRERAAAYHDGGGYGLLYGYEFDAPISLEEHDAAINLDLSGSGFTIRNSEFRAFRYRGILLRTENGLVENNRLFALGNDGIVLGSHLFSEGPIPRNITVRNNTIQKVGMIPFTGSGRGISVWTGSEGPIDISGLRLIRDIVIENNRIADTTRDGIYLRNAQRVTLRQNTLSDIGVRPVLTKTPPQPVSAANVDQLTEE